LDDAGVDSLTIGDAPPQDVNCRKRKWLRAGTAKWGSGIPLRSIPPAILMFVLAQRHIVAGLTAGAVKG
jgi:hypothetical protein